MSFILVLLSKTTLIFFNKCDEICHMFFWQIKFFLEKPRQYCGTFDTTVLCIVVLIENDKVLHIFEVYGSKMGSFSTEWCWLVGSCRRRKNFAAAAAAAAVAVVWNHSRVDGMGRYMYRLDPTGIPNPQVETQLLERASRSWNVHVFVFVFVFLKYY